MEKLHPLQILRKFPPGTKVFVSVGGKLRKGVIPLETPRTQSSDYDTEVDKAFVRVALQGARKIAYSHWPDGKKEMRSPWYNVEDVFLR